MKLNGLRDCRKVMANIVRNLMEWYILFFNCLWMSWRKLELIYLLFCLIFTYFVLCSYFWNKKPSIFLFLFYFFTREPQWRGKRATCCSEASCSPGAFCTDWIRATWQTYSINVVILPFKHKRALYFYNKLNFVSTCVSYYFC